jgi:hypothetical protein
MTSTVIIAIRQNIIIRAIVNYERDSSAHAEKSYERTQFDDERTLFVRIVIFGLVSAGAFDVFHRMNQMAVRNHGMMGGFFELSVTVVLGGDTLVLRGMLKQLGSLQMMIDALLRHAFRVTNAIGFSSEAIRNRPRLA